MSVVGEPPGEDAYRHVLLPHLAGSPSSLTSHELGLGCDASMQGRAWEGIQRGEDRVFALKEFVVWWWTKNPLK